jgi:hypothetical protein
MDAQTLRLVRNERMDCNSLAVCTGHGLLAATQGTCDIAVTSAWWSIEGLWTSWYCPCPVLARLRARLYLVSLLLLVCYLLPSLLNSWCTAKCSISTTSSALHLTDAAKRRELSRIKSKACNADPVHDPRCARLALRRRDGTFAAA